MIFCNCKGCPACVKFDEPRKFPRGRFNDDTFSDLYAGYCSRAYTNFTHELAETDQLIRKGAVCNGGTFPIRKDAIIEIQCASECKYSDWKKCDKTDIAIDKGGWCTCFASQDLGHIDFSRLLNPDGTAKGGHLSDSEARRLSYDNKVTKIFRDHTRQKA